MYVSPITVCINYNSTQYTDPSAAQLLHFEAGNWIDITISNDVTNSIICGQANSLSPFAIAQKKLAVAPAISWALPTVITYGTALSSAQLNATANVPGTFAYMPATGTVLAPGPGQTLSVTFTPADSSYSIVNKTVTINVLYATGSCDGNLGHAILQPINADGSSVFKLGSTVPTKFRVCDVNGTSVGLPRTVASYQLIAAGATTGLTIDEQIYSTATDTTFRWDSSAQQWIFNQGTGKNNPTLSRTNTIYIFRINLNDGTSIQFQYGLK
jgi:hypothetical protein